MRAKAATSPLGERREVACLRAERDKEHAGNRTVAQQQPVIRRVAVSMQQHQVTTIEARAELLSSRSTVPLPPDTAHTQKAVWALSRLARSAAWMMTSIDPAKNTATAMNPALIALIDRSPRTPGNHLRCAESLSPLWFWG